MNRKEANGNNTKQRQKSESNWKIRNNSSNVDCLLKPEFYHFSCNETEPNGMSRLSSKPRRTIASNPCCGLDTDSTQELTRKHCDECYCMKSPVQPKFNVRLKDQELVQTIPKVIKLFNTVRRPRYDGTPYDCYSSCSSGCICPSKSITTPTKLEPDFGYSCSRCCKRENESTAKTPYLDYTTPRHVYERFKKPEIEEEDAQTLNEFDNAEATKCGNFVSNEVPSSTTISNEIQSQVTSTSTNKPLNDILHEDDEASTLTFFQSSTDARANLKKLNTFRKENYFDCYGTDTYQESKDHRCVHRFTLNNRLIPQPLNADPFGTSRCVICDKPMRSEIPKSKEDIPNFDDHQKIAHKKYKSFNSKIPSQINIINRNEKIELKVPFNFKNVADLFGGSNIEIRKPVPLNSIALRYQKGVY